MIRLRGDRLVKEGKKSRKVEEKKDRKKQRKQAEKARKKLGISIDPSEYVVSDGRSGPGTIVAKGAPGIMWYPGQQNFSKAQKKFLYKASSALASMRSMANAMGIEHHQLKSVIDRNLPVKQKMAQLRELTLLTLTMRTVSDSLTDPNQRARVLGSQGIFNERTIQEQVIHEPPPQEERDFEAMSDEELLRAIIDD